MRTTLRIDSDLLQRIRELAETEQRSLTQIANRLLRQALDAPAVPRRRFRQETFAMGQERFDLSKSRHLADDLEDHEIRGKLNLRK